MDVTMPPIETNDAVERLLANHAPVAVGVSGGKDSCALGLALQQDLDARGHRGPRVHIHADLGIVEWEDSLPTCRRLAEATGAELLVVRRKAGGMMERWEKRWSNNVARYVDLACVKLILPWSTAAMRFCTSELKVDVICSALKKRYPGPVLSASGIRRDESTNRRKTPTAKAQAKLRPGSLAWHPIAGWSLDDVLGYCRERKFPLHEAYDAYGCSRVSCSFCLAGETEVVTRNGIVPIRDLAGGRHKLLIPKKTPLGLSGQGHFAEVEVREFGVQPLMRVRLTRGRQRKDVFATPEHRWLIKERNGRGNRDIDCTTRVVTTAELAAGSTLRALKAHPVDAFNGCVEVPFAVAQGFCFGDGAKGQGERPATLPIYDAEKDGAMLPYFAQHTIGTPENSAAAHTIYGLPRLWKEPPDFRESRTFLLSWLSGYFAADGCVTEDGSVRLDSARRESLQVARGIAALCGVGYGPIRWVDRVGTGTAPTRMYSVTFDARDLPNWFFKIHTHRVRIEGHSISREKHQRHWVVESVTKAHRVEPVYCAVVPGSQAFGLADDLMTGNCILASKADLLASSKVAAHKETFRRMVALETASTFAFREDGWLGDVAPGLLANDERLALAGAKIRARVREAAEAEIPDHLLYDGKGWPRCVPTWDEAKLLADVRRRVAKADGLEVACTTADAVLRRYAQLIALKEAKQSGTNAA